MSTPYEPIEINLDLTNPAVYLHIIAALRLWQEPHRTRESFEHIPEQYKEGRFLNNNEIEGLITRLLNGDAFRSMHLDGKLLSALHAHRENLDELIQAGTKIVSSDEPIIPSDPPPPMFSAKETGRHHGFGRLVNTTKIQELKEAQDDDIPGTSRKPPVTRPAD
jgi:hypothetical protein